MKDKEFDRIIRDRLEDRRPEYQPGSWELFEQQLDAGEAGVPEPDDQVIDETAFHKLRHLEKPYKEDHWARMIERLDREFIRPDEVMRFKTLELSLLVLLLFALWNALPYDLRPAVADTSSEAPAPVENPAASALTREAPGLIDEEAGLPSASTVGAPATVQVAPAALPVSSAPAILPPLAVLPISELKASSLDSPAEISLPATRLAGVAPTAELSSPALAESLTSSGAVTASMLARTPVQPRKYIHFGMFGSLDYNRIITPPDRFLDVETKELDRYELGYSGGFSVGVEFDHRWELQTGLIYSSKNYQPSALIVQSGNFRDGYEIEQLKDIELNIIHVPLNFRYNLIHYDKTRFYLLAGASLQIATLGNYYVEGESSRRSSVLAKYIENGWFEGGPFRDNSYLTGNIGFGLEHFVTTRWSVFAQPTYQHALDFFRQGLGSTHDRISTMSIYSGIRVRLER